MTEFASWEYRVVKFPYDKISGDFYLSLCEVYYDRDGSVSAWCESSVSAFDTIDDLLGTLELMKVAGGYGALNGTLLPGYETWKRGD